MTRVCPRCSTPNNAQANTCTRCGLNFNAMGPAPYGNPNMQQQQNYGQPGYAPTPGGYPQPAYQYPNQPPKKSGAGWVIAIIIVLILILGGGGYLAYTHFLSSSSTPPAAATSTVTVTSTATTAIQATTPTAALNLACQYLKAKDYQDLYQLGSQRLKKQVSSQEFIQLAAIDESVSGGTKTCTVSNVQTNGNNATGLVTITTNNGQTAANTESLVLEQNQWKIDTNITQ